MNALVKRATALDALRGLAIIGMVLSGTVSKSLPGWMYHAQVGPRSDFKFDPSFVGITWVDLVFPFFLFAMGAAIPLSMSRKLKAADSPFTLVKPILKRVFLLVLFSIAIYHCTPYRVSGEWNYAIALLAFALFFISFVSLPALSPKSNSWLNWLGIFLLIALVSFNVIQQPAVFKEGFKLSHNDIIILVLANMALFGTLFWVMTRSILIARLAILAFYFGLQLTSSVEGSWNQWIWNFNLAQFLPEQLKLSLYDSGQWLYQMAFLKYLFIIIPGTIVGDILQKWLDDKEDSVTISAPKIKMWGAIVILVLMVISNLYCLYERYLLLNLLLDLWFILVLYLLFKKPTNSLSKLYFELYIWGAVWLMLGNVFEAFEGGIRKDHATMSYFFITTGLAIFALIFFSIIIDYFANKRMFRYISESGQNPMVAYVAGTFVVFPILSFAGIMPWLNLIHETSPWLGIVRGLVITGGMIAVTVFTVRRKWFWKT